MAGYYRIISLSTLPISWEWYRRWLLHKFGPLLISWMPMNWNEWSYSWIECSNEINSGWSLYFLGVIWQILQLMVRRSVKHRKNVKNLLTHALYSTGCRPPFCFHVVPLFSVFQFGFIIYYDFFFFFFTKKIKLHCVGFFFYRWFIRNDLCQMTEASILRPIFPSLESRSFIISICWELFRCQCINGERVNYARDAIKLEGAHWSSLSYYWMNQMEWVSPLRMRLGWCCCRVWLRSSRMVLVNGIGINSNDFIEILVE